MPRLLSAATTCILEVERKFHSLLVRELTRHGGDPPFRSIRSLGSCNIHDVYYDRSNILSSAGVWVRKRNGQWQAKIRKGGDFTNSRFEELSDAHDISRHVRALAGITGKETENFGLDHMATISSERATWIANDEFRITSDSTDFGHTVGEVELQQSASFDAGAEISIEQQKSRIMQEMDERIVTFMQRYAWAFSIGEPKGKLTAYFEWKSGSKTLK
jgi:thiamine-triphosphatase